MRCLEHILFSLHRKSLFPAPSFHNHVAWHADYRFFISCNLERMAICHQRSIEDERHVEITSYQTWEVEPTGEESWGNSRSEHSFPAPCCPLQTCCVCSEWDSVSTSGWLAVYCVHMGLFLLDENMLGFRQASVASVQLEIKMMFLWLSDDLH